jgi:hypothetical protein
LSLDVARLGVLVDADGQREHTGGVVVGDLVRVKGLVEEHLPAEGAVGPLGDDQLGAVGLGRARSARMASTFCSTVRLMESTEMPCRSRQT